jgi:tetratricopeptide (TPR) repeat protein
VLKNNQLAATIYFYKAVQQLNASKVEEAYQLVSKACYLYPDETFVSSMYIIFNSRLKLCKFDKVEDVDLLGQLSRFKDNNFEDIKNGFAHMLSSKIRNNNNDVKFCTDAYNRLLPQINDVLLADEISYIYYITAAYNHHFNSEGIKSALKALRLKPNDKYALDLMGTTLNSLEYRVDDKLALIDTLNLYEKELSGTEAVVFVKNAKMLLYLKLARELFMRNKLKEGVQYVSQFETGIKLPLPSDFRVSVEDAYYEYARYYMRFNNRQMAQKIVNKGLEYIPKSNMIQTATYVMPITKPEVIHRKVSKEEYEKIMKKNAK